MTAPIGIATPLFYAEAQLRAGAEFELPANLGERGIYIVSGRLAVDGRDFDAGRLLVLANARHCVMQARAGTHLMLLGGQPLEEDRAIWWNFVASDPALIEQARADWAARRFPAVPGDDGYMPLPG